MLLISRGAACVAGGGPDATCHVTTMLWKASTHLGCAEGCPGGQGFTDEPIGLAAQT